MGSTQRKSRTEGVRVQYCETVERIASGYGANARAIFFHLQFPKEIHDIKQIYLKSKIMVESTSKRHVIYVLGTTGVGKSKLAI